VGTIVNDDRRHAGHRFSLGTERLNHDTGTAWLGANVPGPGHLAIAGNGVKAVEAVAARAASDAGAVRLLIKPSGRAERTLDRTGKVTVNVKVTYTPVGGTPSTRSTNVLLEKR
jgi:hypothetical protein